MAIPFSKKLSKYYILGEKNRVQSAVKLLQDLGLFHISYVDAKLNLHAFESDILKETRVKNEIADFLGLNEKFKFRLMGKSKLDSKVIKRVQELGTLLIDTNKRKLALEEDLDSAIVLSKLGLRDITLLNYHDAKILLLMSKHDAKIDAIRKVEFKNKWFYLIDSSNAKESGKLERINIDNLLKEGKDDVNAIIQKLTNALGEMTLRYGRLKSEYRRLIGHYGESLQQLIDTVADEVIRKRAIRKIADEGKVFIISGFAPDDFKVHTVESNGFKVITADFAPQEAPTIKPTAPVINNFAFLTWLYGVPKYGEIEPSFTLMITFPLLFGAIVGDIGYGLVLLVGSLALYYLHPGFKKNLFWIFALSGVSSIVFGFLFGEFFGNLISIQPLLFYRLSNVLSLIFGSIFGGSVILSIAFVFNEINAILEKNRKSIISGSGWLLLNFMIFFEAISIYFYNSLNIYVAGILPLSIVLVGAGNLYEASQALNLFTNVVSYIRIAAVGLSSAMIAMLINLLGNALIGYSIFIAVIALVLLHLLNILLDALIAFLQSLRLEYVEFLSKFLNGGGTEYEPLEHVTKK